MQLINKIIGGILGVLCVLSFEAGAEELFPKVAVSALPEINIDTVGVETAVPTDIWGTTDSADVQKMIQSVLKKPLTPSMQTILTELMMTKTHPMSLPLVFRLTTLMHLGQWDKVLRLIELIPQANRTDDINVLYANALFLSGQTQFVCDKITKGDFSHTITDKMQLPCALVQGDKVGASLIFSARQENQEWDKMTQALGDMLFNDKHVPVPNDTILPKHLPLLAALKDKINWDKMNVPFALKKAVSSMDGVPWDKRILMAEQTATPEQIKNLYLSVPDTTSKDNAPTKRAELYRQMAQEPSSKKRAELVKSYLDGAMAEGVFLQVAPLMVRIFETIPPEQEQTDVAFYAVWVYALAHRADSAYAWMQVLQNSPDNKHQLQYISLIPLMQQMGAGIPSETVISYCLKYKNEVCATVFDRADFDITMMDVDLALYPWGEHSSYAPTAGQMIGCLIETGRSGEAWLHAVQALQDSPYFEKEIVRALQKITPASLSASLITERYLLNETKQ